MSLVKYIPNAVTARTGRALLHASKHSPTILFAAGVVGVVATAVVASHATLKVEAVLDEAQADLNKAKTVRSLEIEQYTEQDYKKDVLIVYTRTAVSLTKLYAPAVGIGILTIAALTGSHRILVKRNLALTAAYSALDQGFKAYRRNVIDAYGEEADSQMRYGSKEHTFSKITALGSEEATELRANPGPYSIYARFFDRSHTSWSSDSQYNSIFLKAQQNHANDLLHTRGHIFLNEVYDMLGMARSRAGAVVGWVMDASGDNYVDFGVFLGNSNRIRDFMTGHEGGIWLDFNVDGVIYDKI
jgi:hypothetical protein